MLIDSGVRLLFPRRYHLIRRLLNLIRPARHRLEERTNLLRVREALLELRTLRRQTIRTLLLRVGRRRPRIRLGGLFLRLPPGLGRLPR